jgi:hypothetical protein
MDLSEAEGGRGVTETGLARGVHLSWLYLPLLERCLFQADEENPASHQTRRKETQG